MDEMTRQTSMAWKRGRDFGLAIGIGSAILWTVIVVLLAIITHGFCSI